MIAVHRRMIGRRQLMIHRRPTMFSRIDEDRARLGDGKRHHSTIRGRDATTGGRWSDTSAGDTGEDGFFGSFHELRDNERSVHTFAFEGFPDAVNLGILTLTDLGAGRTRLQSTTTFDSLDSRDAMVASGMDSSVREGYAKLDALLAEEGSDRSRHRR